MCFFQNFFATLERVETCNVEQGLEKKKPGLCSIFSIYMIISPGKKKEILI